MKRYKQRGLSKTLIHQQVYVFIRKPDLLYVYRTLLYIRSWQIYIMI